MKQTTTTTINLPTVLSVFFDTTTHRSTKHSDIAHSFATPVDCLEAANFRVILFCFRYVGHRDSSAGNPGIDGRVTCRYCTPEWSILGLWRRCFGKRLQYLYVLAKTKIRKSEAWQQKVDYNVALSEAVRSRLVTLFYIRTDFTSE
jgi:hypothetical protein